MTFERTLRAFGDHCDWAHQCWQMTRELYDDNPNEKYLRLAAHRFFFVRLRKILHEYWLAEVSKLGDPATMHGHENLSIDLILSRGNWPDTLQHELTKRSADLMDFIEKLTGARNKLLAHKDLKTIVSEATLGDFEEREDHIFFEILQEFVNITHEHVFGQPRLFDDLTKNDVEIFMETFIRGETTPE